MNSGKIIPSYDNNRQILGEIYPLETPFNLIIDSAEACNFKCNYCFRSDSNKGHWGYAKNNQIMSWDIFEKAVQQVQEFPQDVKQISLSNHGEPLANRKLPDMVRYIKRQGIKARVAIHTNAALLNEAYIYDLADSNIDRIVISLQGLTSERYEQICGVKINFNEFYNNLVLLSKHRKDTQIQIKIANVALEEHEEERFFRLFEPIADRIFVEQIVPIWENVKIAAIDGKTEQNKFGAYFPRQKCCPLIFHTLVVAPGGDVYPCTQLLSRHILGNINDGTLAEYWHCGERKELLLRQVNEQNEKLCGSCYILQNSILSEEDMIDDYRVEIRKRLLGE